MIDFIDINEVLDFVPFVGGFIGALIGGALGLAGSMISGSKNRSAASASQARQIAFEREKMKWERENYQHLRQWEVEDLKAAGLNPILSSTGGSSVGSVGSIGAPFGEQGNFGESAAYAANALSEKISKRQLDIQERVAESQIEANSAAALKTRTEAMYTEEEMQAGKIAAEVQSLTASALQSKQVTKNLVKEGDILAHRLKNMAEEYKNLIAQRDKLEAETGHARDSAALVRINSVLAFKEIELKEELRRGTVVRNTIDSINLDRLGDLGGRYGSDTIAGLSRSALRFGEDVFKESHKYRESLYEVLSDALRYGESALKYDLSRGHSFITRGDRGSKHTGEKSGDMTRSR